MNPSPQTPGARAEIAMPHRLRATSGVAIVITLLMLSVITFLAIAFVAMSTRNRSAVSASMDTATARAMSDAALARAQAEVLAQMLAHGDPLYYDYMVSRNYISPFGFVSGSSGWTNVNYDSFANATNTLADWVQNIANLYYDPRPPVFVQTNPALPANYDFRFWVDINRNGRFETNGYQPTNDFEATGNFNGNYAYLNGEPEFIGVLRNPLQQHSSSNQFIGRYAYMVLPIGKTLDLNYIHNQLKGAYQNTVPVYPTNNNFLYNAASSDGFVRDQGIGSWELNLAGFLDALSPWAYEGIGPAPLPSAYGFANSPYLYTTPNSPLNNSGYAFQDAESILHYRYMPYVQPAPYSLASLPNYFPYFTNLVPYSFSKGYPDFTNNWLDMYCETAPMTAPFDYPDTWQHSNYQQQQLSMPWAGSFQTNLFFDVQDLFDTNKTSTNFVLRMLYASQRTNTFDRYTFLRLLSCIGVGSSPEYGVWVNDDNGHPTLRTKVNINYDNTSQINSPTAPYALMPTNLVPWTPLGFFTNAAELLLRSQSFVFTNYYVIGQNLAPLHFGVTNIPVFVAWQPGIHYSPAIHRMLQLAANIYDATSYTNTLLSAQPAGNLPPAPPVRHPSIFRPLFQIVNQGTTNASLYITGYAQVMNGQDAWTNLFLKSYLDVTSITNIGPGSVTSNTVNNYNFAGIPWIVAANKGLPAFYHYTAESEVLLERKLLFQRYLNPDGTAITNKGPQYTNQFYCMDLTNTFGMDAWNAYPSNFYGATNGIYCYFSNFITIQLTNESTNTPGGYFTNIIISTYQCNSNILLPPSSPLPPLFTASPGSYGPIYFPGTGRSIQPNITNGFRTMYNITNFATLLPAYYSLNTRNWYYFTNNTWFESNSFRPADLPQAGWPYFNWTLNVTNHVVYALFDGPPNNAGTALLDYVNLGPIGLSTNLVACAELQSGNTGTATNYWTQGNANDSITSPASTGMLTQITNGMTSDSTFLAFMTGSNGTSTQPLFSCPVGPTFVILQQTNWVANDPLVHYTAEDLVWPTDPTTAVAAHDYNVNPDVPLLTNSIGSVSARYAPWGANDSIGNKMLFKDPLLYSPSNWDFPTNKFPGVGWIGRVHRGTPWQTVYLKADNPDSGETVNSGYDKWPKWVNPFAAYPQDTYPTNDWSLVDLFTTSPNDDAARGLLSVNQTNDAAWAAVFAGVIAPTNANGGAPIWPNNYNNTAVLNFNYTNLVDGPNGINGLRTNLAQYPQYAPYGIFHHIGDILAAPALTVLSPYLLFKDAPYNDEMVERIPQQTLSLLKLGEPQFVVFAWGQSLKPKGPPYLGGGPNQSVVTNYEITGEILTRTVCHVEHANGLKLVIDSFNVESGNPP
jgi:hypothetical protein